MLTRRDEGGLRALDDLAMGLETGEISRGKAIKLGGAALVASALSLFASRGAEAQLVEPAVNKKKCRNKGNDYCKSNRTNCKQCCKKGSNRPKACCGTEECNCCKKNEKCNNKGQCHH